MLVLILFLALLEHLREVFSEYSNVINFSHISYIITPRASWRRFSKSSGILSMGITENNNFFLSVLFSDESSFTNHRQVNRHNMHYWAVENPHWLREVEHQRLGCPNIWCGIIRDKLIGFSY